MSLPRKIFLASAVAGFAGAAAFFAAALTFFAAAPAFAAGVEVSAAWTRATVRGASVGVGFMTIDNQSGEADTLTGGACDCAERVEIHETREEAGIMTMRAVPKGVEIKPGNIVTLKPGTFHLMLIGLKTHFLPGESVHLTLHFAKSGDVGADLKVEAFGAQSPTAEKPPTPEKAPDAKPAPTQPSKAAPARIIAPVN
jgi:copper(I)-binding protein